MQCQPLASTHGTQAHYYAGSPPTHTHRMVEKQLKESSNRTLASTHGTHTNINKIIKTKQKNVEAREVK